MYVYIIYYIIYIHQTFDLGYFKLTETCLKFCTWRKRTFAVTLIRFVLRIIQGGLHTQNIYVHLKNIRTYVTGIGKRRDGDKIKIKVKLSLWRNESGLFCAAGFAINFYYSLFRDDRQGFRATKLQLQRMKREPSRFR